MMVDSSREPLLDVGIKASVKPYVRHFIASMFLLPLLVVVALRGRRRWDDRIDAYDHRFQVSCNYLGDASFALTGTVAAGGAGLDVVGCAIVGFVTALGGGSFRDVVLGRLPLFWLTAWDEALLCFVVSVAAFFLWPRLSRRFGLDVDGEVLFWADAVGLGVFAANGAVVGARWPAAELHFCGRALCGMFTACFGGLARDVLLRRPPRILHSHEEAYATPALLGGVATAAWLHFDDARRHRSVEAALLGTYVTVAARVVAVNRGARFPTWEPRRGG